MSNSFSILEIYPESFRANVYTSKPFRMIGLIDVKIKYDYGVEIVTLSYYRSSGTNSGKIKGLWYPIVGIKTISGSFTEFTPYINKVLTKTTHDGRAKKRWLAKSLFFRRKYYKKSSMIRGFSNRSNYKDLLWIGKTLRDLYEAADFKRKGSLDAKKYNKIITSNEIYAGNKHTQKENFEKFVRCIYKGY